jgi:hypothetical protein
MLRLDESRDSLTAEEGEEKRCTRGREDVWVRAGSERR